MRLTVAYRRHNLKWTTLIYLRLNLLVILLGASFVATKRHEILLIASFSLVVTREMNIDMCSRCNTTTCIRKFLM